MEMWASDGFYSHFPSYSQQPTRREALAKARQLEYQTFLSRVTPKKSPQNFTPKKAKVDGKGQKRHTMNDDNCKRQKVPTTNNNTPNDKLPKLDTNSEPIKPIKMNSRFDNKNRFQDELEHLDLPDIFNDQIIRERNEKLAEEKRLKNIEYQQELMAQIEQKRREREQRKAKEEEDEERLTKRMEEQMKMVRLQDEVESQRLSRHREHKLISVTSNRLPIVSQHQSKPPITVRSEQIEPNTYRSYDDRKAQSDCGKENWCTNKRNDKDIYNYFTNSAQQQNNQLKDIRYNHYFDSDLSENDLMPNSMSSFSYNTYPSKSSRQHDVANKHHLPELNRPKCNFCKKYRFLGRHLRDNDSGYICDSCEKEPVCLNCRKEICVQCKRPTQDVKVSKSPSRHLKQRNTDFAAETGILKRKIELQLKPTRVRTESFQQLCTDEDETNSDLSSPDHKPFSFNIDESSLFHPSKSQFNRRLSVSIKNGEVYVKPDSFEELKRIYEEKSLKYAKNYSDIRFKKPIAQIEESRIPTIDNSKPISSKIAIDAEPIDSPLLVEDSTKTLIEFAKELERGDNNMFRRIEQKHQIPANFQSNNVVENSDSKTSTLTQVGAFKKHLQLDKLNF